jgi:hypothetical protein
VRGPLRRYTAHVSRLDVQLAPEWNFHFFRGISTPRKMEVMWNLAGWAGFVERPRADRYTAHVSRLDVQLAPEWNFHFFRGISMPRKMEVKWNLAGWAGFVERPRVDRYTAPGPTRPPPSRCNGSVVQDAAAWRGTVCCGGRAC